MNLFRRFFSTKPKYNLALPIVWEGDLDDDCTARWNGLILRAEWMEKRFWWWAVSINKRDGEEIDSSNNYNTYCIGGEKARKLAESCARNYLESCLRLYHKIDR